MLAGMSSLEQIELWACLNVSDAGVAKLARLPRLRQITLDGNPGVTPNAASHFPSGVRVKYSG